MTQHDDAIAVSGYQVIEDVQHQDGWANLVTGIGGPKDKSTAFRHVSTNIDRAWYALEEVYEEDHVAGKIVDARPEAVFGEHGASVEIADQKVREAVVDELDRLEAEDSIETAMKWENLHGGSAIFLGVDDGRRFEEPLDATAVRRLMYLHVYDRWELWPYRFYTDPTSPKYGKPSHYRVSPSDTMASQLTSVSVHESRFIIFPGVKTTKRKLVENQYWGQSRLVRAYQAIKQYGGALASVLASMADSSQGVYKIKDLMNIIQGGNEAKLQTRFRAMDKLRSVINSILLDADGESYERITTPLTELANLVDKFMINVAGAAGMPVTELFGISAAGLNATGENDLRSWHAQIEKDRRKKAKPALDRILSLLFASSEGPTKGLVPDAWEVKFPPLWVPTAAEQATIQKTKMETALLALDGSVLNQEQIARSLFTGSAWDGNIVLKPDEINALRVVGLLANKPQLSAPPAAMSTEPSAEPEPDPLIQDDEDELGEELSKLNPVQLAEKMTAMGVKACEHGKKNVCRLCGIERERDLIGVDNNGDGIFDTKWRAIGARAQVTEEPDPDAADE